MTSDALATLPAGQPAGSLAEVAGDRWIHGWGEVGDVTDMLAALSGFRPRSPAAQATTAS